MSGDPTFYLRHRFFRFFRFTVASDIFWKKHFPLLALGIHYFPKKTAFPKIFPAIYFKLLSWKNQKTEKTEKTYVSDRMLGPQTSPCQTRFFRFFRFTVASDIFLKKTLSITGPWYSLFP